MRNHFLLTALLLSTAAFAQNEGDVQRYSSQPVAGTARFMGLGGAMGALGGDLSAVGVNPAGIGIYRFSELSFTPSFEINSITSQLNDRSTTANQSRLVINNAGFVLSNELKNPDWKALNFGISYTRINTFNDDLVVNSVNPWNRSLMQDFVNEANGSTVAELSTFSALLAWESFVIDTIGATNYAGRVGSGELNQFQRSQRSGRQSETTFNFGTNYKDVLYLGASLGIQGVRYELETETSETPTDQSQTDLSSYKFTENLEIQGTGFNFKIGAIVKAGKILRFGGSIQSPTGFRLTDTFRNTLTSQLRDPNETIETDSGIGTFEYRVRTPWRYMLSAAGILGKKAIVSAQYEYVDFAKGELRSARNSDDNEFQAINDIIGNFFSAQNVYRLGLEYRFTENFYARGGFAYFSNVIEVNEGDNANLNRRQTSLGLGYREAAWSLDLTYQLATFDEPYLTNRSAGVAVLTNNLSSIAVTLGLRL